MKIDTSSLTGAALDWAVATALHLSPRITSNWNKVPYIQALHPLAGYRDWGPSTDWYQGGAIIEHNKLHLRDSGGVWRSDYWNESTLEFDISYGPTPLIAAMRAYVSRTMGSAVDIPEELA